MRPGTNGHSLAALMDVDDGVNGGACEEGGHGMMTWVDANRRSSINGKLKARAAPPHAHLIE